jgi:hypothetical protein
MIVELGRLLKHRHESETRINDAGHLRNANRSFTRFRPKIASGHLQATSDGRASRAGSLECVGAYLPASRCSLFNSSLPCDIHSMTENG